MAEGVQDHPVTEPAAVEGQASPPAEAASQTGTPKTHDRRFILNAALSLLIAIGIVFLKNLSTFAQVLFSATSLCSVLITWFLTLRGKDIKKDFNETARNFLESRSCTWSLALPAVAVWIVYVYLAGSFGWMERRIAGEPVVLRVVPAKGVFQILDGTGAGNGVPIVLRLHYHGRSTDYPLEGAGVIYLGSSASDLQDQVEISGTDEKTVSDAKKQRSENLKKKLTEYLANEGVPKENLDPWLTKWGSFKYLDTPVFRVGEKVEIDLVCADSLKIMAHIPEFHLSRNQSPVYLERLEEHNPCVPPS